MVRLFLELLSISQDNTQGGLEIPSVSNIGIANNLRTDLTEEMQMFPPFLFLVHPQ